jgi:hypothetical protein
MEICLPDIQSCPDKITDGSVTAIGLPETETEAGEVFTARSSSGNGFTVKSGEAGREGFTAPGFCPSGFLCGNIETRLDFEAYAFKYEDGVPVARSRAEREAYLRKKVERLCSSCLTRKNAKDLFPDYRK